MAEILAELRDVHVALGERRTGSPEEQREYLLARSTNTPLPELHAAGINTNDWPAPPHSSPARPGFVSTSRDTEQRITSLFESAGPLGDLQPRGPRYEVRYRPQDRQRYKQVPLDWAIWDTETDLPIAYHQDKELAEYQADNASARYAEQREAI
ncbi:hypothetical protein [Streptomyces rimosus]|uniref:hypothetical protein n=1 Tax=Streptomyces rimosus TaxID=1927 RepID=UPI0004BFC7E3|nr:hypothetical protein [Streptomyces rimosus]